MNFKYFITAVLVLGLVTGASAQLSQTGALVGKVVDSDGVPLPGTGVTIKSPALIRSEMSTISNAMGIYRFPSLPPGTYELVFELDGFSKLVRQDIKIGVGRTSNVDAELAPQTIEEEIVIIGESPTVDLKKTTTTVNLTSEFLTDIPAVRNLSAYVNMTPGFTSNTAHGSSVRDNTYNLDGVNLGDPTVGTQGVFFGMDIMDEVSVQTGGLSAEYGGVRGAVINVVSKSGGNRFSGSGVIYYRHENLQSDNTKDTPLEGDTSGYKYELEPAFTLGGPVVQDKLWFFLNFSLNKREQYVAGYPYDQETNISADDTRYYPYVKLSFQPSDKDKFVLSYNYSDIRRHHRTASRFMTEDTTFEQVTPTHVFNLHWTRFFSPDFYTNLKVGYVNSDFNLLAKNTSARFRELATGEYSGGAGYDDLNERDRLQVNADATYFADNLAGSHELKIGGEFTYSWSYWGRRYYNDPRNDMYAVYNYGGTPFYGVYYADMDKYEDLMNVAAFLQDAWTPVSRVTLNLGLRFEHQRGIIPPQMEESDQTLYGYTYNRSVNETMTPLKWTTLAPRLGAVVDLTGDGKTLLKASFARYYAANITQWFSYNNPNDFVYAADYLMPDGTRANFPFALYLPGSTEMGYGDYDLKNPYVDELTIGIEREIFEDASLSARYIRKWDRDLIEDVDANALEIDTLMETGELVWTNYVPVTTTDPYNNETVTFWNQLQTLPGAYHTLNPPGAERDYDGVEITFNKRFSHGWSLLTSYTWQKSRGLIGTDFDDSYGARGYYDNPNTHINAYGRFPYERRHQFKMQGSVRMPLGIIFSGYLRYLSGARYTRLINSLDLGLDLYQGEEDIYAEERGTQGLPAKAILDLRLEKQFHVKGLTLGVFADGFNILNGNKAVAVETLSSNPNREYGVMTEIQDPRMFRLGFKFAF